MGNRFSVLFIFGMVRTQYTVPETIPRKPRTSQLHVDIFVTSGVGGGGGRINFIYNQTGWLIIGRILMGLKFGELFFWEGFWGAYYQNFTALSRMSKGIIRGVGLSKCVSLLVTNCSGF